MLEVGRHAVNRTPMRSHRFFALHAPTALSRSQSLIDRNHHPSEHVAKGSGWVIGQVVVAANVPLLCDECLCNWNRHPLLHFAEVLLGPEYGRGVPGNGGIGSMKHSLRLYRSQ